MTKCQTISKSRCRDRKNIVAESSKGKQVLEEARCQGAIGKQQHTRGVSESTKRRRTAGYNKVYFSWYYVKLGSLAELELFKKHSAAVVAVGSLNMHAGKRPNTPSGPAANAIPLHAIILPQPHTRCSPIKQLKCRLQRRSSSYSLSLAFYLSFSIFLLHRVVHLSLYLRLRRNQLPRSGLAEVFLFLSFIFLPPFFLFSLFFLLIFGRRILSR